MNAPVVAGDVIAEKYRVDRILGSGELGTVAFASHLVLPQRVAIELLLADGSPERVERSLREARAAVALKGDHVARVLDVGQLASGVPYIVTEHLDGQDLSELLRGRGRIELSEAIDWVLQACVAVAEAHAAGIVHRDLEPARLFLATTPGGATLLKVLGFGASRELPCASDGGAPAPTGEELGAPLYMSPERMRSSVAVDARADVWSLGAILYRLLTGRPPFEASSLADLAPRVASAAPVLPSALRSDIPPGVDRVLLCCLEKDPARRPASVAELAIALAPHASAEGQDHVERAARLLGATLPSRPRASLPTIGLGLSARPRPPESAGPSSEAAPETLRHGAQDTGRHRARIALIAAVASLLAILGVAATQLR
ncbi:MULTISPECIES: serine/threonine-protein kinase [Sorangium]|uniref:Serine/threonine-protein kinase n=1 Tax=Sorangium atrum TaxID=2995308 RepID=A0ABT5C8M5_9BACT|nr:serine/threonine-protein kinase [Sorangium aterium]MDC0682785.1 serine/threonine-protein kinase [Sorangium aterium]